MTYGAPPPPTEGRSGISNPIAIAIAFIILGILFYLFIKFVF